MRTLRRATVAVVLCLAACSAHQQAATSQRTVAGTAVASSRAQLPPTPDVSKQVMGWVVLSDGRPLVKLLAAASHVATGDLPADAAAALLGELVGLDRRLVATLDLSRPMAIGVLNPSLLKHAAIAPLLAMVPVKDPAAVERALTAVGIRHEATPWGGLRVDTKKGPLYLAFRDGYAEIAGRPELVDAASKVLRVPLGDRSAPLVVHVAFDNVYSWYGRELTGILRQLALTDADGADPQLRYATRAARLVTRYTDSLRDVDILVGADGRGLTVSLRAQGKPGGEWAGFVASQQPAPTWGTRLLPPDTVLVYATRRSPVARRDEIEAAVSYLGDTAEPPATEQKRAECRGALELADGQMSGEEVYAVWPGDSGGVGVGGAYRLGQGAGARSKILSAYQRIASEMVGVVARQLELDARRYQVQVKVHEAAAKIGQVPIDTVEVSLKWPEGSDGERARFEALFGKHLVLASAFVGDTAVYALGRGWRTRLEQLVAAASGQHVPSLADDPTFADALAWHARGRVSFTYLPTQGMVDLLGTLLSLRDVPAPRDRGAQRVSDVLTPPPAVGAAESGAIVATTNAVDGRYEVTSRIPVAAVPSILSVGGALWRIAIAPILNPPTFPPLPLPPPHVTPHMAEPQHAPSGVTRAN